MGRLIGYFIVFWILLGVFSFVFTEVMTLLLFVKDFFIHTQWGWYAIICIILTAVFAFASKVTHEDVVIKDEIMGSLKASFTALSYGFSNLSHIERQVKTNPKDTFSQDNRSTPVMSNSNEISKLSDDPQEIIDLSRANLDGVLKGLAKAINKPAPVFFKGWGNRRLQLDVERVGILEDYIRALRGAGNEFLELKADAIFSHEKLEHFIKRRRAENINELDLLNAQALDILHSYEASQTQRDLNNETIKTSNEREQAITKLLKKAEEHWEDLTPEQRDIVLGITTKSTPQTSSGLEEDINAYELKRLERDLAEKDMDILAKKIANKKSDIERKSMDDNYKRNKDEL